MNFKSSTLTILNSKNNLIYVINLLLIIWGENDVESINQGIDCTHNHNSCVCNVVCCGVFYSWRVVMSDEEKENKDKQEQDKKFEKETEEFEKEVEREKARILRNLSMRYWR